MKGTSAVIPSTVAARHGLFLSDEKAGIHARNLALFRQSEGHAWRQGTPACAGVTAFLLLLIPNLLFADINLKVSVEPREATVGDRIQFKITAVHSFDIDLKSWPAEKNLGNFEVVDLTAAKPRSPKGNVEQDIIYTLAAFEVGISTLPAVPIIYTMTDGTTREISTPEIPVNIKSVLGPDAKDIREIKGPLSAAWKLILIAIGIILSGLGGYLWWRRRKLAAGGFFAGPPPRPAHEIALEAIGALESALGEPAKKFYSRLSDILRQYIEGRFGVPAMDRTTSELFQEMKRRPAEFSLLTELRGVLDTSDLAKFAKWDPTEDERRRDVEQVKQFVLKTRPVEIESKDGSK